MAAGPTPAFVNSRRGPQARGPARPAPAGAAAPVCRGGSRCVDGPVLVGGLGTAPLAARARDLLRAEGVDAVDEVAVRAAASPASSRT